MAYPLRARSVLPWILPLACAGAVLAACGGGGSTPTTSATSSGTGAGPNTGGGGLGGGLGFGGNNGTQTLTVSPATATLTVNAKGTPVTQSFAALIDGSPVAGTVGWTLDTYAEGSISGAGTFTTTGLVGGQVTVTATVGKQTATAVLTVKVDLSEDVLADPTDPGPSATNKTALQGAPMPDPGATDSPPNPTKILYPYDKTVMPRGLTAPLLQFSPGNLPPEDARIALTSTYFSWQGFVHVQNGAVPQFSVPQDIWDAALLSTGGQKLQIDVTKAVGGQAYGPATTSILVAPGSLKGAVYYMTYETPGNGLYSVKPGVKQPASLLIPGCVVCHSVSSSGNRLATGADQAQFAAQSGIYDVGSDGSATQITGSPAGLGGDSRGISLATFTPDGNYVMRSQNNFWGGPNQQAWKIDDVAKTLTPATVIGLGPSVSALVPAISPDTKHYAFTNGPGEPAPFGTVSRSVSLMDLAVDPATDTLTFSNRQLLVDNGPGGSVTKFVNFLPDPSFMVLQEGEGYQPAYDEMLPTWDVNSTYTGSTGRLYMIKTATQEHLELATLNAGNADIDRQRNYEPFPLPVTAGGYFWIVFTSIREYGNTYTGGNVQKQLWVAAISTNPGPGEDPSHPPFYLPNQSATRNERGYWALEPCRMDGADCETGDECCDGFCRPADPNNPMSPKVCQPPMSGGCSQISEKCVGDADCCDGAAGARCIGGFCTPKSPN
jgi:hypothetical protein